EVHFTIGRIGPGECCRSCLYLGLEKKQINGNTRGWCNFEYFPVRIPAIEKTPPSSFLGLRTRDERFPKQKAALRLQTTLYQNNANCNNSC
ncbi:MAG: hypothetical protein QF593_10105, partial [Nitrospinota bacterium]|nr:hypothetical protein [Nitrospinota bacterium]